VYPGHHLYAACWGTGAVLWAILGARELARCSAEQGGRALPGATALLLAVTITAAVLGAKLHFLLTGAPSATGAGGEPGEEGTLFALLLAPGLRISGALLAGGLTLVLVGPRLGGGRLRALVVLDALAPPAGVAIAIGRLGCIAAGCCFGTPTRLPWAIRYPAASPAYWSHVAQGLIAEGRDASLPVHPLPLYLAGAGLLAALVARGAGRCTRREGTAVLAFVLAASALRLAIEPFRETHFIGELGGQRALDATLVMAAGFALALRRAQSRSRRS
jgi:prolipoprotein diacylglyceryltransferase